MTEEIEELDEAPEELEAEIEEVEEVEEVEGDEDAESGDTAETVETADPSVEEEARKWGWKPKKEWRGNTEGWVPAEKFVNLPSTDNKRLRAELREKDAAIAMRMERLERTNKAAMDRALSVQKDAHNRQLEAIRQAKRAAADSADIKEYDRLEAREIEVQKNAPKEIVGDPPKGEVKQPPAPPAEILDYGKSEEGRWLNNPVLVAEAKALIDSSPVALSMGATVDQVKWAKEQVRNRYPAMFPDSDDNKPSQRSRVDGGGLAGRKASPASKLPPEARAAAKDFVAQGLFKSVDDYAKTYFEQEA